MSCLSVLLLRSQPNNATTQAVDFGSPKGRVGVSPLFFEIIDYLNPGDLLVVNDTRVIPARFYGRKLPGGGRVEVLLLNKLDELRWEALVGGSGMKAGRGFLIDQGGLKVKLKKFWMAPSDPEIAEALEPYLTRQGIRPCLPISAIILATLNATRPYITKSPDQLPRRRQGYISPPGVVGKDRG